MASQLIQNQSILHECWNLVGSVAGDEVRLLESPENMKTFLEQKECIRRVFKAVPIGNGYSIDFLTKADRGGALYRCKIVKEVSANREKPLDENLSEDRLKFLKTCVSEVLLFRKTFDKVLISLFARGYNISELNQLTIEKSFNGLGSVFLYLRERFSPSHVKACLPKVREEKDSNGNFLIKFPAVSLFNGRIGLFQAHVKKLESYSKEYTLGSGLCWDVENRCMVVNEDYLEADSGLEVFNAKNYREFFKFFPCDGENIYRVSLSGYIVDSSFSSIESILVYLKDPRLFEVENLRSHTQERMERGVRVIEFPTVSQDNKWISINAYIRESEILVPMEGICWNLESSCLDPSQIDSIELSPGSQLVCNLLKFSIGKRIITVVGRLSMK